MIFFKRITFKDFIINYLYIKARLLAEYFWFTLPNIRKINKIKKLEKSQKGKNAFVFANGSSMSKLDPYKIKKFQELGYDVFAGNSYINSHFAEIVNPNYYIFSDHVHFGIKCSKEVAEKYSQDVKKILKLGVPIFIPHRYCKGIDWPNTIVFNDSIDIFSNNVIDMTKRKGYVSMTLFKALSAACYMGYDKIYISGFDNDYFKHLQVDENNDIYYLDIHFYDEKNSKNFQRKEEIHSSMGEVLLNTSLIFDGLQKFKNLPIVNLDKNGLVDSFSKNHILDVYKNEELSS